MTDLYKRDCRATDTHNNAHERDDRLFSNNGLWYFKTTEGKEVGPFRYRNEAELMLTRFVAELQKKQEEALAIIKPHFRVSAQLGKRAP